jgi:hypothetical protein
MKIVPNGHEFKFKKLCPYCGADLVYVATGWTKHPAKNFWKAEGLESRCLQMPDEMMSEEWDEWMNQHSYMTYVYQLPVDNKVEKYINAKFRFKD